MVDRSWAQVGVDVELLTRKEKKKKKKKKKKTKKVGK